MCSELETLLQENKNLIHTILKKYKYAINLSAYDYQDFYQEGVVAFIEAYNGFDPNKGDDFIKYASKIIANKISRFAMENTNSIKFPFEYAKVWKVAKRNNLGIEDLQEIAELTNLPIEKVAEVMQWEQLKKVKFLNENLQDGTGEQFTLEQVLSMEEDLTTVFVNEFLQKLDSKAKSIVALKLEDKTQKEISEITNIPQQTVSRILKTTSNKLKIFIGGDRT